MRRPMLFILIVVIVFSYIYTNKKEITKIEENNIKVSGIVTNIEKKEKYICYEVNDYLVQSYNKNNIIKVGSEVIIEGKNKDLNSLKYDDFDYGRYLKSKGYRGLIYLDKYEVKGKSEFYTMIGDIKEDIYGKIQYLYKEKSSFLQALIIGIKNDLTLYERDLFSKTGISHIVSISGMHISIIAGIIIILIGKINKIYKFILLEIGVMLYYLIVGEMPSIQRAIIFSIINYVSFFIDRRNDGISSLSIIGVLLITNNPYIIYNLSFQLSFLATLSIIYFRTYIKNIVKSNILAITISANILTIPIIYYYFNIISIVSIISNVIVTPFIGAIMIMGIFSVSIFELNVSLAKYISSVLIDIINSIYILLDKLSGIKFAYIEVENPKIYYVIIYYVVIFIYMVYKERKTIKEQKNELQGYC